MNNNSSFADLHNSVTSRIEVLDITTGKCELLREFPYLVEAPNWTADGAYLFYNSNGRIYRISLAEPNTEPVHIYTGVADNCNNDHLVSPDGSLLAVSHRSLPNGKPTIFVLPAEGGEARQVCPSEPSYLHGWSPDGQRLTYCANRKGEMDVYTIALDGKDELRLTTSHGLNDGPEYSPCGRFIWFNSERTGLMQLWRMRTDGSEQTQMTLDSERNSWFPHLSPDGKQVAYIAYRKGDLEPHEHLRNMNVEIRLMPSEGGEPATIVSLFGGQGSFNVNSWAPDSRHLAFVRYKLNS